MFGMSGGSGGDQVGVKLVAEGLAAFERALDRAQGKVDTFAGHVDGIGVKTEGVGPTSEQAFGLMEGAADLAAQAIQLVIDKIVELAGQTVETAARFEDQMAILEVVTRRSGVPLKELSDFAIEMGQTTIFSAEEAAAAMVTLAKSGYDVQDIYAAMPGVVNLAAASNLGLEDSAFALVQMLSTFGLSTDQTEDVVNRLVKTADASVLEVNELVGAMVNAGPTAALFGQSLEDTCTALALFSERGIRGASAGTLYGRMLLNMNRDVGKVHGAWDALGVSMYDAEGRFRPINEVFADLSEKLQVAPEELQRLTLEMGAYEDAAEDAVEITEQTRTEWMQIVGGTYGIRGMAILLDEGAEGWQDMADKIEGSADASTMAEAKMDTFHGRMEKTQSAMESMMINAGMPFLEDFLEPLQDTINLKILPAFDDFIEKLVGGEGLQAAFEGLLGVQLEGTFIGDIFAGVSDFLAAIQEADWEGVGMLFEKIVTFFADLLEMTGVTTLLSALAAALPGLGEVIGGIVDAIGALGRGDASQFLDAINQIVQGLLDAFGGFFEELFASIDESLHRFLGQIDYVSYLRFDEAETRSRGEEMGRNIMLGVRQGAAVGVEVDPVEALFGSAKEEFDKFGWDGANALLAGYRRAGVDQAIIDDLRAQLEGFEIPRTTLERARAEARTGLRYGEELTEEEKVNVLDLIGISSQVDEETRRVIRENWDQIYAAMVAVTDNPTPDNVASARRALENVIDQVFTDNPELETLSGEAGQVAIDGIFEGMNEAIGIMNWGGPVQGIFIAMQEELQAGSPAQLFVPLGEAILDGMLLGMRAREGAVIVYLNALADKMIETIEGRFGIASPSGVFADIGASLWEGLVGGFTGAAASRPLMVSVEPGGGNVTNNYITNNNNQRFAWGGAAQRRPGDDLRTLRATGLTS